MERVLPDIDAHNGDRRSDWLRHGVLLGFGRPQPGSLAGGAGARPDHPISGPWATLRDRLSIQAYSITSSARPSSVTGTSRPSVFAVLGLMNPSAGIRQLPSVALLATFAERCMRYRNRSPAAILPFLSHYSSDYPVRV